MLQFIEDLGMKKDSGGTTRRWCIAKCNYCGKESEHRTQSLKNKKSCGCATELKANNKHGMSNTRQYQTWAHMKDRCNNYKNKSYIRYGGRGITYDSSWETFEGFWKDMQDTYFDNGTLERINNSGNYCKENCKWITIDEQANNRNPVNTFKIRDKESYSRKITLEDIKPFGEKYKNAKYGEKKKIIEEMSNSFNISINTSKIYLIKYKKGTLCKLV